MQKLYAIGEFSKLTDVSIDTLRYYDKIGLLSPEQTDANSSYRYYAHTQLNKLDIIKICRELGLSLAQTKGLFAKGDPFAFEKSLTAQYAVLEDKIRRLERSCSLLEQMISRLRVFEEISAHSGFYSREIPPRKIVVGGEPVAYANMDLENAKVYATLEQKLRNQGVSKAYEGGFIFGLRRGAIEGATMFECIPPGVGVDALAPEEVAGGRFFCMNYSTANREETLTLFLDEIGRIGLSPAYILDIYLIDGRFSSADRRFELQCPDDWAGV